ncbi:DMT family transporter [Arundinibacter roseus]|uniref:DMT family transporter n=1 Tax=Arundinibacter roseus TaxID=2070510 RepID=A0A4R4KR70_9BACT|nr:DMT family transporter [Arundinibacter roseus]TDB69159.1 DMT family transporter [Arundinibacter roseus]
MNWIFLFIAFLLGVANTAQSGINSQLRVSLNNPILAAILSFMSGLIVLIGAYALFNQSAIPTLDSFRQITWWKFTGGLLGAFYVVSVIFIVQDLGPANMLCLIVAGQLISALIIDHYGWLGFSVHAINLPRVLGSVLLILGVYLILKY